MKVLKYLAYGIIIVALSTFVYMKIANKNTSELGLDILSMVKNIKGEGVPIDEVIPSKLKSLDHSEWSAILDKFVSSDGKVDYRGMRKKARNFNQYLDYISLNPPASNWNENEKLCYWINAYNAFTVKLILDHYPLKSIKDISDGPPMVDSPWDLKFFKIGGVDFDLNTIEHEILRKEFNEPRIHFAINCASYSCPKLRDEAYLPKYLEAQLEDQARYFINNNNKNQISKEEMKLSSIFNWFNGDFTKEGSLHAFLKKYNQEVTDGSKVSYLEYNWELNG